MLKINCYAANVNFILVCISKKLIQYSYHTHTYLHTHMYINRHIIVKLISGMEIQNFNRVANPIEKVI